MGDLFRIFLWKFCPHLSLYLNVQWRISLVHDFLQLFKFWKNELHENKELLFGKSWEIYSAVFFCSSFHSAIETAGLASLFADTDKLTVVAPTNEAFDAMDRSDLEKMLLDPDTLEKVGEQ